ncbi:VWA domain-containing protein [Paenibacillus dendritiformis]|uniref:VWA domain-containing protein n=1 Tax=Paenibacillus dendritiformis TaxID=130049 RepID=UPI00387E1DFC
MKHYDIDRKPIVPERFYFFDRAQRSKEWTVIFDIDQSGSMADSVIWACVIGSIFASIPALDTRVVVFDTEVADLTEQCANDPVEMLFGYSWAAERILISLSPFASNLSRSRRIRYSLSYPLCMIVSDLYEGGNRGALIHRMRELREAGGRTMCLLALSDQGQPFYDENLARVLVRDGTPCFACTSSLLPELVEGALKGHDLAELAKRVGTK